MAPPKVTDRNGNVLQKGDKVLVEMTVGDIPINAPSERELVLTSDVEGAPTVTVYAAAVHVIKKDDYGRDTSSETATDESRSASQTDTSKTRVTAPGAPKNRDGTLNTKGATQNDEGNWEYSDGTVRRPDGSVV